jgi:hypothetical protein
MRSVSKKVALISGRLRRRSCRVKILMLDLSRLTFNGPTRSERRRHSSKASSSGSTSWSTMPGLLRPTATDHRARQNLRRWNGC